MEIRHAMGIDGIFRSGYTPTLIIIVMRSMCIKIKVKFTMGNDVKVEKRRKGLI